VIEFKERPNDDLVPRLVWQQTTGSMAKTWKYGYNLDQKENLELRGR
jgi:hypothetical protein